MEVQLLLWLDLWRADRFDAKAMVRGMTRGHTRVAFLRAQSFLDQRQGAWGRTDRQRLFLRSLAGALKQPVSLKRSLLRRWARLIVADGQFSQAERATLRDYAHGFGAAEPTRAKLLALCNEADDHTKPKACLRHAAQVADELYALNQALGDAGVPEPIAAALKAYSAAQASEQRSKRSSIERELVTNLRRLRQAQDNYLIKHAAALASKQRQVSGETPILPKAWWQHSAPSFGELVGAAKARAHFTPYTRRILSPEARYAFFEKNRDRLAVPATHRFVGVSVNVHGYQRALKQPAEHAARYLRALRALALEDPKGFYAKAEAFFATPVFAADRWGRAHKHFEWVATDAALSDKFWTTNLRRYQLTDQELAALRGLKLGEVSEIFERNGTQIFMVYSGYEPPKTGWANLRHADALNQALWDQEAQEQVRAERDRVLELGAPLAATPYPARSAGDELMRWDAVTPKSGAFHALRWKPVTPVADGKVAASYWIEVAPPQGDQPPVFTVYGRAQLPGAGGVLVYALRSDAPKDAKPQAVSVDPNP
jgi:DnaJ-domain-containing protein 1